MKVGLYLMTRKGLAVLDAAVRDGVEIAHVTTAPATGMDDDAHREIEKAAKQLGVPAYLRAPAPEHRGDWSIAAGWRWMIDDPNLIVFHDSMLPRYRGFSPMVTALVSGERELGATAFWAKPGLPADTGPIVAQRSFPITYPIRADEAIDGLCRIYSWLTDRTLGMLAALGQPLTMEQDESRASYSLFRDDLDYRIDWGWSADRIQRLVDAVSKPFPGAWTLMEGAPGPTGQAGRTTRGPAVTTFGRGVGGGGGAVPVGVQATPTDQHRIRVHAVSHVPDRRIEDRQPGKFAYIEEKCPVVVCGQGLLRIDSATAGGYWWGSNAGLKTRLV